MSLPIRYHGRIAFDPKKDREETFALAERSFDEFRTRFERAMRAAGNATEAGALAGPRMKPAVVEARIKAGTILKGKAIMSFAAKKQAAPKPRFMKAYGLPKSVAAKKK